MGAAEEGGVDMEYVENVLGALSLWSGAFVKDYGVLVRVILVACGCWLLWGQ